MRPTFAARILTAAVLAGCTASPAAAPAARVLPTTTAPASASPVAPAAGAIPNTAAPVAVLLDVKTTVLAVLDLNTTSCGPRPACIDSLPAVAAIIKEARDATVSVAFGNTTVAGATNLAQVAPQGDEPVVIAVADKFVNSNFDTLYEAAERRDPPHRRNCGEWRGLYTSFGACARGYTVVVAEDGISSAVPFATTLARFQLLNQRGFPNADNKPLAEKAVTISRGDLIAFK